MVARDWRISSQDTDHRPKSHRLALQISGKAVDLKDFHLHGEDQLEKRTDLIVFQRHKFSKGLHPKPYLEIEVQLQRGDEVTT